MNRRQWREFARTLIATLTARNRQNAAPALPRLTDLWQMADDRAAAEAHLRRRNSRW
ncbi:hypothetical protein [Amycolatopsis suaedae]|uniref:hypothetical protein n=1 Tax=Amycolatopsis suaedae TaxID=2510978 RepID=UPI0013EEF187|nr:hypothetical protein [Amycolatopsis suaedae]